MRKISLVLLLLGFFLFAETYVYAQRRPKSRKIRSKSRQISSYRGSASSPFGRRAYNSVTFHISSMNYFGDLAPKSSIASTDISFTRPGIGVSIQRKVLPRVSVRGGLLFGRLQGSDFDSADPNDENARFRYVRNLQFRNDILEFSVSGVFDLIPSYGTFVTRSNFVPYVFAGVAVLHHNPQGLVPETDVNTGSPLAEAGQWVDLEPLGTEGQYSEGSGVSTYSNVQFAIPVGLGVRYRLSQAIDLELEVGYRHLFFDHIDDVSGSYVDLGLLNSNLARAMSDRSREVNDVNSGNPRELTNPNIAEIVSRTASYVGADGRTYNIIPGYGQPGDVNIRGNSGDDDIYIVTSLKLTYIFGGSLFGGAKYR
ncbi:MAG: DUF6089 family protein [Cytophagales bacterium]|nr:DUF6089 family protein [Cytophagales bacterium]